MICNNCESIIPDDLNICPGCEYPVEPIGSPESAKKEEANADKRKEFSHYKVTVTDQGPRASTIESLIEISGLDEKQVKKKLKHLPWIIANRVSNAEAQEIKMILQMNKARVIVEGVDIWEEEGIGDVTSNEKKPKSNKLKIFLGLFSTLAVLVLLIGYVVSNSGGSGGLLKKVGSGGPKSKSKSMSGGQKADGGSQSTAKNQGENKSEDKTDGSSENKSENASPNDDTGKSEEDGSGDKEKSDGNEDKASGDKEKPLMENPVIEPIVLGETETVYEYIGANPFTSEAKFLFEIITPIELTVNVYDRNFKYQTRLLSRKLEPERYIINWKGKIGASNYASSGSYILEIIINGEKFYQKFVWLTS